MWSVTSFALGATLFHVLYSISLSFKDFWCQSQPEDFQAFWFIRRPVYLFLNLMLRKLNGFLAPGVSVQCTHHTSLSVCTPCLASDDSLNCLCCRQCEKTKLRKVVTKLVALGWCRIVNSDIRETIASLVRTEILSVIVFFTAGLLAAKAIEEEGEGELICYMREFCKALSHRMKPWSQFRLY